MEQLHLVWDLNSCICWLPPGRGALRGLEQVQGALGTATFLQVVSPSLWFERGLFKINSSHFLHNQGKMSWAKV